MAVLPTTEVPVAPGGLPVLGHALTMRRELMAFLRTVPQHGEIVRIHIGPRPALVVTTPDLVRQVLVVDAKKFHKGRVFDKARPFMGNGLVLSNGDYHLRQRRLAQPAFHRRRVAEYVQIMSELSAATADEFTAGQVVDVREKMYDLVIGILGRTLFSTELGGWATREAQRSMPIIQDTVVRRTMSPLPFLEKVPTRSNRRFNRAVTRLRHILDRIIAEYLEDGGDRGDLLSMLVAARDEGTGEAMSAVQLRDEVLNILAAGMETSTDTLAWAFHELGRHPDIEQRAHEEAERILGGRSATIDDLAGLTYIQHVVKEVLRVHPPTNLLMRKAVAPVELNGFRVAPGTEVIVSPLLLHHNPSLFSSPSRFDPDRWSREETAALPRGAYLPFGMGNRQCLGDSFAMTEMPVVLATILARWHLRPLPGHVVRPVQAVTVSPGRLPMVAELRSGPAPDPSPGQDAASGSRS